MLNCMKLIGQIYLEESDPYVLTAADIDNWVTLPLLNPTFVTAGTSYMAAVEEDNIRN